MPIENSMQSFRKNINQSKRLNMTGGSFLSYREAVDKVVSMVNEQKKKQELLLEIVNDMTKEEYRENIKTHYELISDLIYQSSFSIKGYELEDFILLMTHRIAGFDILDEAYEDTTVSDIHIVSWDTIFIEKDGEDILYHKTFDDNDHYKRFVERIVGLAKKQTNKAENKILDFELFGDRFSVINEVSAIKGHAISIRKHPETHRNRRNLIEGGTITLEQARFIDVIIQGETNTIMGGITGSGKTTSMRALLDYSLGKNKKRVLVCEDTRELYLENKHTVDLVSIKSNDKKLALTLYEIVLATLRLKPKYIIVGEVRGAEAISAVEAMETGHSTHMSMHGGSTWNILNRLINKYMTKMAELGIEVVERIIGSALDYVMIQHNIPGIGFRITSIDEISYDFVNHKFVVNPIFKFNQEKGIVERVGSINKEKADQMMFRGVKYEDIKEWVEPFTEKEVA